MQTPEISDDDITKIANQIGLDSVKCADSKLFFEGLYQAITEKYRPKTAGEIYDQFLIDVEPHISIYAMTLTPDILGIGGNKNPLIWKII